jgi:hypothetical protein
MADSAEERETRKTELPVVIWLCPAHHPECWVPHGGVCPEVGCQHLLVPFTQVGQTAERFYLTGLVAEARRVEPAERSLRDMVGGIVLRRLGDAGA